MRLRNQQVKNGRIDQTPDWPFRSAYSVQLNAVSPFCSFNRQSAAWGLLVLGPLFDVLNHVANRLQLLSVFVRNFDGKFFLKCHHEFDDIQRVCP